MYLRALYLSLLLVAAASAWMMSRVARCDPAGAARHACLSSGQGGELQQRWRLFRSDLEGRLSALLAPGAMGLLAGALLRLSSHRRPASTSSDDAVSHTRVATLDSLHPVAAPYRRPRRFEAAPGAPLSAREKVLFRPHGARMSALEKELLRRMARHPRMPCQPGPPSGPALFEHCLQAWRAAADAFGAGTLESQLALLRHAGCLYACRRQAGLADAWSFDAEPGPLALQVLRDCHAFSALPIPARRQLMQGLYALQTGWVAEDIEPCIEVALSRLNAAAAAGACV